MEKEQRTLYDNVRCCLSLIGMVFCNNCSGVKIMGREFIAGLMIATCFYMVVVLIICLSIGVELI